LIEQLKPDALVIDCNLSWALDMSTAQVAVGHAGHGTTLAPLCNGVPIVCVPGLGRDQVPIAHRVAELGLGIVLPSGAGTQEIQAHVGPYQRA
jgi:UDP:flavonoid glycosyltransferase YjiC (YdhE family)